jgi:hypothetical protein
MNGPMNAKVLFIIGLTWLGIVLLWLRSDYSFFLGLGHGKLAKAVAYILPYVMLLFTIGWIVPLSLGAYRLLKKH